MYKLVQCYVYMIENLTGHILSWTCNTKMYKAISTASVLIGDQFHIFVASVEPQLGRNQTLRLSMWVLSYFIINVESGI